LEEVTVIGAAGRGRLARLQFDRSDAVFDSNQVIRFSAEAIAFGYERWGLWKGAADVRVENVSRGEAGSREQSAPHEPCQGRGDEGKEEEHRLQSISAGIGPKPVGRSKHHGNEQSASCAIHYAPGLIHTARMLLMIINAGVPLLNLHPSTTLRALKYQDRQKHQSAISEARMRSRLGIAISAG
jgi:hypothetical protein